MKIYTLLICAMTLLAQNLFCNEPVPQLAQFEYSKNNVEITYCTIQNFKDNEILTAIEEQNYNYIFGLDSVAHMDIATAARKLAKDFNCEVSDWRKYGRTPSSRRIQQHSFLTRQNRVLCYQTIEHVYYTGAAHGSFWMNYHCYDLKAGKCYNFDYLFEGEIGKAVRKIVFEKLRQQEEGLGWGEPQYLPKFDSAALLENSILFVYQPYTIASYADGIIEVEVNDEELLAAGVRLPL